MTGMVIAARQRPKRTRNPVRYVYFVQAAALGLIKVGLSNDVTARLRSLGTDSPDQLLLLGVIASSEAAGVEERLHFRFRAHRSHGEWFHPHPDVLSVIEQFSTTLDDATEMRLCSIFPDSQSAADMERAEAALERFLSRNGLPPSV